MKKEIFSGIGLGLLIGTIIGLSMAQVTGLIIAALTSLLAAFFGLQPDKEGGRGNNVLIGAFSFTCLLSILFGLYIRTHNLLSPSPESEIAYYKNAGFKEEDIKKLILLKNFGVVPEGYNFNKDAKQPNTNSILMSGESGLCYINDSTSLADIKKAFHDAGLNYSEIEEQLALVIKDEHDLKTTLLFFKNMICTESNR